MKTLHIIVANKIATYSSRGGEIVCGNSDYQIKFNFDTEWDAYETKTARFIWNGKYKDVVFTGAVCPVPIVANTDRLEVGVYAEDISTTTSAVINCKRSILCNSDVKSEGTVIIPEAEQPDLEEITITENGEYTPSGDGYSKVIVAVEAEDSPLPIEVSTEAEMTALLESGAVGGVYKYMGETTDTYENGALYVFEKTDEYYVGDWVINYPYNSADITSVGQSNAIRFDKANYLSPYDGAVYGLTAVYFTALEDRVRFWTDLGERMVFYEDEYISAYDYGADTWSYQAKYDSDDGILLRTVTISDISRLNNATKNFIDVACTRSSGSAN